MENRSEKTLPRAVSLRMKLRGVMETEHGQGLQELANPSFVPILEVGPNVTSFADTTLFPITTYTYRVRAFNLDGCSFYSNPAAATTLQQGPPPAPIEQASNTDWFCMTFLDADNGWAGGQDQTIDDVPGSIWKRSGSLLGAIEADTIAGRTGSLLKSGVWRAPPSRPGTEPDGTR